MLSKAQITLISSLQHKKYRKQHGFFTVEGIKSVNEFINSAYIIEAIYATEDTWTKLNKIPQNIKSYILSEKEFQKISNLRTPQGAIALVQLPQPTALSVAHLRNQHTLVLDSVQDPGNMGTIIRTADWFGIKTIICSPDTVDIFNPKVVQATMGSLSRMHIHYTDLEILLRTCTVSSFGAVLEGTSIYKTSFDTESLIILGNEGNGIRPSILELLDYRITIPAFGQAESLNVAVAATVFCSEIARQTKS